MNAAKNNDDDVKLSESGSGLHRMNLPLALWAAEKVTRVARDLDVSKAKFIECLMCLNDDELEKIVKAKLSEVDAIREHARKSRLGQKHQRQTDVMSRLKTMSAEELERLEKLLTERQAKDKAP